MASILALSTGRLYPPEGDIPRTPFYCSPCRFQGQSQLEGLSGGKFERHHRESNPLHAGL